ncbi:Suppression of tumorigenicity 5 protein [Lamellibrachia satsuma]|nr:Suppression of tumorigenicity 5 protein [Lamellibrachia satsuma]
MFDSEETFINPTYAEQPANIPVKAIVGSDGKLKRYKSDEYLYAKPPDIHTYYNDPVDCVRIQKKPMITEHGVVLDPSGYAVPEGTPIHLALCKQLSYQCSTLGRHTNGKRNSAGMTKPTKLPEKVKRAYSVLRPRMLQEGLPAETAADDDDSDNDVDIEQHRHRVAHVNSTREKYGTLAHMRGEGGVTQLFNYALIVSLGLNAELNQNETRILFDFPQQPAEKVKRISEFCFPDASTWKPKPYEESETFSFVLTNEAGQRQYGHCRRIVPAGQSQPEVLCVVSPVQAFSFYDQLLEAAERKRDLSLDHAKDLLQSAYGRPMPGPGKEAWIRAPAAGNKKDTLVLERSRDRKLDVPFDLLLSKLSLDVLLKVFGSILLERRLIFMASSLSTLTGCIHALVSLMYPFEWMYTFVPVLPASMIEICCSPTPFIAGVLTGMQAKLRQLHMEQVLIVDLDKSTIIRSIGDEAAIIPKKLQKALIAALMDESDCPGSPFSMCADAPVPAVNRTTIVFEAFLRMFVETIGHYTEYIVTQQDGQHVFEHDGQHVFEKESFVKAVSSKSIRMFLEWFTQTQHFEVFITHRLEEDHTNSVFEMRVYEYRDEMEEMQVPVAHNVKSVGKKMINFFVESGDKIKKAFRRNVFI